LLAEGKDVAAVCRELGVSEPTYHRWRNQFGGLKADDAKRLKDLERENSTLKRLLADAELEKAALKEIARDYSNLSIRPLPSVEESLAGESGGPAPAVVPTTYASRCSRDSSSTTPTAGSRFCSWSSRRSPVKPSPPTCSVRFSTRWGCPAAPLSGGADMQASTAIEYDDAGQPMPNSLITERAAGGLYSTATDMARFMASGMPGPEGEVPGRGVLMPETFSQMTTEFTPPDQKTVSLGYEVETLNGATGIGHGGSNTGTSTQFLTLPDRGEGIVVLSNSRDYAVTGVIMQAWGAWQGTGSSNIAVLLEQDRLYAAKRGSRPRSGVVW